MPLDIAILMFDRLTALDAIGPYEVLSRLPGSELRFVASEPGIKRSDQGTLAISVEHSIDDATDPDIVVVPGGYGELIARDDQRVIEWLRAVNEHTQWTTSVCTGSLLLGAAGLLLGRRATSHWTALEALREFGAEPSTDRVVVDGKIVTAAGVSSGIDMALWLCAQLAGDGVAQAIQLSIEYDPDPPFDSGSPVKAHPAIVEYLRSKSRFADL